MSNNDEFVAWLKGYAAAIEGPPSSAEWELLKGIIPTDGAARPGTQPVRAARKRFPS